VSDPSAPEQPKYDIHIERAEGVAIGDGAQAPVTAGRPKLTPEERAHILAEFRAHLRRVYAALPLEGLALPLIHGRPLDPALLRIPLDRVYIKLRALPHESRQEKEPSLEDAAALSEYVRERHRRARDWKGTVTPDKGRIIPPEEAVAQHNQLVILGDPGAGKSTFLRHLAWREAEGHVPLPLLVPLGRADVAMQGGQSLLEAALDILTAHKVGEEKEHLRAALEAEISNRQVRGLWDGLDEVRLHHTEVIEALGRLAGRLLTLAERDPELPTLLHDT